MKLTTDLLFEIGCEEIPAGMLPGAIRELQAILEKYLNAYNLLQDSPVETFGAPRRLAAICANIHAKQPDEIKEVTGRPKSSRMTADGKPTRAAESFAQKVRIIRSPSFPLSRLLRESICSEAGDSREERQRIFWRRSFRALVAEITWPRSMYWTGAPGCILSGRFGGWWLCLAGKRCGSH